MKISKNNLPVQNLSFEGYKKILDKKGETLHSFYYLYDKDKYNCEVELYKLKRDSKDNYELGDMIASHKMPSGDTKLKLKTQFLTDGFAYRFKLTELDANGNEIKGKVSYAFDNGSVMGIFDDKKDNKYNIVLKNRATINKNGPMQLIMPDGYNPQKISDAIKAKTITRTHANKLGGELQGIVDKLDEIEAEGIVRIVGTPYTKDSISSHKYWTENAYRVAPDFGKEKAFEKLQVELFKHGINWISDAALVNEGLGGVHVSELLRHGDDSYAQNMFNVTGPIAFGVEPNQSEHIRLKFINAPFKVSENGHYTAKNDNYDSKKPTYIQFYDDRLASEAQKKSNELFYTYDNKTTDNIFEITKHDDAVYPYYFEVSPKALKANVEKVKNSDGKVPLNNIDVITGICEFPTFQVIDKSKNGGIDVWEGNVDIPKLKFFANSTDSKDKQLGALAVRDYSLTSGKYWTQLASSIQMGYVSKYLSEQRTQKGSNYLTLINEGIDAKALPQRLKEVIDSEVVANAQKGDYKSRILANKAERSLADYIVEKSMDLPLETIPVSTNLLGILTSPYMAKKPYEEDQLGISRFDFMAQQYPGLPSDNKIYPAVDEFYTKALTPKIMEILSGVEGLTTDAYVGAEDNESGISGPQISDKGKYVVSEIAADLTKYLILKSLALNSNVEVDDNGKIDFSNLKEDPKKPFINIDAKGNFDFSNVKEEAISIQSLGIPYDSFMPESEAAKVLSVMKKGLESIPQKEIDALKQAVSNRFKDRTLEDFRVAEMIIDRTESGLGWRIDATKDIADVENVRTGTANMNKVWDDVIDFWKKYNEMVLEQNPHAYTTAEITDLNYLFAKQMPKAYDDKITENINIEYPKFKEVVSLINAKQPIPDELKSLADGLLDLFGYTDFADFTEKDLEDIKQIQTKLKGNSDISQFEGELNDKANGIAKLIRREEIQEIFDRSKYLSEGEAERRFLEETGITSVANYNFFFSLLPSLYSHYSGENGQKSWQATQGKNPELREKLDSGWSLNGKYNFPNIPGFLFQSPADGVKNSYTFVGNHDKPRLLHSLALNMGLFHSDFDPIPDGWDKEKAGRPEIAKEVLMDENPDFDEVDPHAIAVGYRFNQAFEEVLKGDEVALATLKKAVSQLASGEFKGKPYDVTAFGTKPFELTIKTILEQVEYNSSSSNPNPIKNKAEFEAEVLKNILEPAFDRFTSIYKLLITLPGSPTDFAGDKVAATGYETKSKNYYQQNRNPINWNWLNDKNYSFVKDFNTKMTEIANLRSQSELSALNDGDTVTLPVLDWENKPSEYVQSFLRYNDKGSVVLTLHNNSGAIAPNTKLLSRKTYETSIDDSINNRIILDLDSNTHKQGLKHGLAVGTQFKKYGDNSSAIYEVCTIEQDGKEYYCLKGFDKADELTRKEIPITIEPKDLNTAILYKVN